MDHYQEYRYHYINESEQYAFYRLPKVLFTDERYRGLSDGAKILYGLMVDRMSLSLKNNWCDESGRAYIIFALEEIVEFMGCKRDKVMKMLSELDIEGGKGLIRRARRGQGKASIIYVLKFIKSADFQKSEKPTSRSRENRPLEVGKTDFKKSGKPTSRSRKSRPK